MMGKKKIKYLIIDESHSRFGQKVEKIDFYRNGTILTKTKDCFYITFKKNQIKPLENIYLTSEEVSERSKKFAKMEQRILDWIEQEKDLEILHKLENLLK